MIAADFQVQRYGDGWAVFLKKRRVTEVFLTRMGAINARSAYIRKHKAPPPTYVKMLKPRGVPFAKGFDARRAIP